jgi:hypothetical protein
MPYGFSRFLEVTTEGYKYVLTFQDELSKYTTSVYISKQDAETIARVFVQEIVVKFGILQFILTDKIFNLLSELFTNVCKLLKIKNLKLLLIVPKQMQAEKEPIEYW